MEPAVDPDVSATGLPFATEGRRPLKGPAMLRKLLVTVAVTGLGLAVVACNTVQGAGKDMQSAGRAISTAAN